MLDKQLCLNYFYFGYLTRTYQSIPNKTVTPGWGKWYGSGYFFFFFFFFLIQIINPIVFSTDDTNMSCLIRSIVDCEIAHLGERIWVLKSRRNELSTISCLPTEILCNIFSLVEDNILSSRQSPSFWINFSQVLQHWRSVALSMLELWTKMPLSLSPLGTGNVDKVKNGQTDHWI